MHATQTPTLSQPRAGGARILGAALALAAAFTAGAVLAVNLPPLSIGTSTGTTAGPGIHSVEWLRNHHRGASAAEVTAAQGSLTELRRGEIGALGAPGAVRAQQQTPAQSTLDYWRAYADQRVVADPKAGASFMGGVPDYVLNESYKNSVTPLGVPSVQDPMGYWNSITLRGGLLPTVSDDGSTRSIVTGEAPASVLDAIRGGAAAPAYPGKVVDPVSRSEGFAPLAGDWILTAPSPAAAPYMPKLEPQGINHPTLPAGHAKAPTAAAGNDTERGITHR